MSCRFFYQIPNCKAQKNGLLSFMNRSLHIFQIFLRNLTLQRLQNRTSVFHEQKSTYLSIFWNLSGGIFIPESWPISLSHGLGYKLTLTNATEVYVCQAQFVVETLLPRNLSGPRSENNPWQTPNQIFWLRTLPELKVTYHLTYSKKKNLELNKTLKKG